MKSYKLSMNHFTKVLYFLSLFLMPIFSQTNNNILINYGVNCEVIITVNPQMHINYGLSYPITYEFSIPSNSCSLKAMIKNKTHDEWDAMTEKTNSDYFNGIQTVRFDYSFSKAYVSVAFSSSSDSIFIKLTNSNRNVCFSFLGVSEYYDNRKAVVTATADDWSKFTITKFNKAIREFRFRNLWFTGAIITGPDRMDAYSWNEIQKQLDSGFVEIVSHSRTHPHHPYPDLESEIIGSKDDIINYLNLPSQFKYGNIEYVYSYIYPYGNWSSSIDRIAGINGYLICRTVRTGEYNLTEWNSELNIFNRVGAVYEVGAVYSGVFGISDINVLNNKFTDVVDSGKIYHFTLHPAAIYDSGGWELPYLYDHLDYISNHKNIWYVGFGQLYLYQFIKSSIRPPICLSLDLKVFLEGTYNFSNEMTTKLNQNIPTAQPFNCSPCYYSGTEINNNVENLDIVDWVLVSLFSEIDDQEPEARRAGFLRKDGKIVDIDGLSPLKFNVTGTEYFVKIEHRNHLPIVSSQKVYLE
jgi:hypothetical protein